MDSGLCHPSLGDRVEEDSSWGRLWEPPCCCPRAPASLGVAGFVCWELPGRNLNVLRALDGINLTHLPAALCPWARARGPGSHVARSGHRQSQLANSVATARAGVSAPPWPCTGLLRTESLPVSPPSASLCPPMLAAGDCLRIGISWPKGWHRSTNPRPWGAAGRSSAHPAPWHAAGGLPVCAHPPPCAHPLQPLSGTRIFPVPCCRCRCPLAVPGSVTARRAAPNLGGALTRGAQTPQTVVLYGGPVLSRRWELNPSGPQRRERL